MDQKLEFSFKGQVVGFFEEPNYPRTAGRYRYMPYRGPGHRDMQVALESGTVRCSFKDGFTRYEFMVSSVPESHVLSIDTVRRRRFSLFGR